MWREYREKEEISIDDEKMLFRRLLEKVPVRKARKTPEKSQILDPIFPEKGDFESEGSDWDIQKKSVFRFKRTWEMRKSIFTPTLAPKSDKKCPELSEKCPELSISGSPPYNPSYPREGSIVPPVYPRSESVSKRPERLGDLEIWAQFRENRAYLEAELLEGDREGGGGQSPH